MLTETPGSGDEDMKPSREKDEHDGTFGSKLDDISQKQPQTNQLASVPEKERVV